jgi:hypothetical protein
VEGGGQAAQEHRRGGERILRAGDRALVVSAFGQESNQTTWRLTKMNLAIRHIDSSQVKWNNEGSFLNDSHKNGEMGSGHGKWVIGQMKLSILAFRIGLYSVFWDQKSRYSREKSDR